MRRPFSFTRLHAELSLENLPDSAQDSADDFTGGAANFDHHTIFIVPQRAARSGACRRLKDLRTRGRAAGGHLWPAAGVYTVPQLAARVLRAQEQRLQRILHPRETLGPLESLAVLAREYPNVSPRLLEAQIQSFGALRAMGLDFGEWSELVLEYESTAQGELQPWTERILNFLRARAVAAERGKAESDWDGVERATQLLLEEPHLDYDWARICERDPRLDRSHTLRFVVPATREPFALERKFIDALSQLASVEWMRPAETSEAEPTASAMSAEFATWRELRAAQLQDLGPAPHKDRLGIYWGFAHERPGPVELSALVPGSFALDTGDVTGGSGAQSASLGFVRALKLWADYHAQSQPGGHPFAREAQHARALLREHFSPESPPSLATLCAFVLARNPARAADVAELCALANADATLEQLPRGPHGAPPLTKTLTKADAWLEAWVEVMDAHQLFCFDDAESTSARDNVDQIPSRVHPRGLDVLGLDDLGVGGHEVLLLWSHARELAEMCDVESPQVARQQVFPPRLAALLEARGYAVPDPAREIRALRDLIFELRHKIAFLDWRQNHQIPVRLAPVVQVAPRVGNDGSADNRAPRLSPSAVEAYFRCHFRYYLSRELRLSAAPNWDPTDINPLARGTWMHRALEDFFAQAAGDASRFEAPHAHRQILSSLRGALEQVFDEKVSADYKNILGADAEVLALQLSSHLEGFERDLAQLSARRGGGPARTLTELRVEAQRGEILLAGTLDRVDLWPDGSLLIWDYKSGAVEGARATTQIRNGRMQWFLYRAMLEAMPPTDRMRLGLPAEFRVLGGGYLNPMFAAKSSLFVTADHPHTDELRQMFARHRHPAPTLGAADDAQIARELDDILRVTAAGIAAGDFSPVPLRESECLHCEHAILCGRPFLREELR